MIDEDASFRKHFPNLSANALHVYKTAMKLRSVYLDVTKPQLVAGMPDMPLRTLERAVSELRTNKILRAQDLHQADEWIKLLHADSEIENEDYRKRWAEPIDHWFT